MFLVYNPYLSKMHPLEYEVPFYQMLGIVIKNWTEEVDICILNSKYSVQNVLYYMI